MVLAAMAGKRVMRRTIQRRRQQLYSMVALVVGSFVLLLTLIFMPDTPNIEVVTLSDTGEVWNSQSTAYSQLSYATTNPEQGAGNGVPQSMIQSSDIYTSAVGMVPAYVASNVQNPIGNQLYSIGTPTRQYDAEHAYVFNTVHMFRKEYEDIKYAELALQLTNETDYSDIMDYVKKGMSNAAPTKGMYTGVGGSSSSQIVGALGPAVMIRDFYTRVTPDFSNWWSDIKSGFKADSEMLCDLMLVAPEDTDDYLNGNQVDVAYVQFKFTTQSIGGKGHIWPWGFNQTYIQTAGKNLRALLPNKNDPGAFTSVGSSYPAVDVVYDSDGMNTAETYKECLHSVMTRSGGNYWMPTLEAKNSDIKAGASVETYRVTGSTGNMLEAHPGAAYDAMFGNEGKFKGWSLVGILVYSDTANSITGEH